MNIFVKVEDALYTVMIFALSLCLILSAIAGGVMGFNDAQGMQLQSPTLQFVCAWGPVIASGIIGMCIGTLVAGGFMCIPEKAIPLPDAERLGVSAVIGCFLAVVIGFIALAVLCGAQYLCYAIMYGIGNVV